MLDVINRYTHGFLAIPVILSCKNKGFFKKLKHQGNMTIEQLVDCMGANSGHLQVALRLLQSLGWLLQNAMGAYMLTEDAESHSEIPEDIIELYHLPQAHFLTNQQGEKLLGKWIARSCQGWQVSKPLMADFLDGTLVVPILLVINQHKEELVNGQKLLFSNLSPLIRDVLSELFVNKGWAYSEKGELSLTSIGQFMLDRALIMGTTASYTPMLSRMPELLFGSHQAIFTRGKFGGETHVNRTLNVLASGFQHEKYFAEVNEIILTIFNRLPFAEQPKYVADMGCGDGSLLKKIYETICTQSARGKVLDQYPITMLGLDYNQEALAETARTLFDIPHRVLHGDIGDPERMIVNLANHGIYDPENILHIRSFLDHDRPYIPPTNLSNAQERTHLAYQGVYVDKEGKTIPPAIMVQSLIEHLRRWAFVIGKHGLIILEVHCLGPTMVHAFLDHSESLHFDAYHAFSMQYLVEAEVFLMAAAEAGLFAKSEFFNYYPKTFPFSRITLSWFEKRPYSIRHAHPRDLSALIKLEKACWSAPLQVSEIVIRQRLERFPEGQCVLEMDGLIVGVVYSQRISTTQNLETTTFSAISSLQTSDGPVVQLMNLNIFPDMQHLGLGDQLLEFMLQYCTVKSGIKQVVGVTRCKNYVQQTNISMETYIRQRDEQGHYFDPILRFHHSHGAEIKGIVYGYRPEDVDNQGNGILIEYDLHHRQVTRCALKPTFLPEKDKKTENLNLLGIIEQSIRSIMGNRCLTNYSPKWPLNEMGMDSLDLLELRSLLSHRFDVELEPSFFFRYGTPQTIASYFQGHTKGEARESYEQHKPAAESLKIKEQEYPNALLADTVSLPNHAIAIIGMACRFPQGANNPDAYWSLLRDGIDAISEIPKTRWDNTRYYDPALEKPGKICTNAGGFLDQVDQFDALFFRISPREAEKMDPQQRLLLEVNWEALEQAGLSPATLEGSQTGIFTGIFSHDYETLQIKRNEAKDYDSYFGTGNSSSMAAGRLAYFLNFQGPAISIDTACSSSLVAVHLACQSLAHGECNLALVSGVNLLLSPELSITFSRAGMLSPDGYCKTFDASANGYVRSEGCAAIVLKRLPQALANNDNILAIIRGSAINQDGTSNGLTAPNGFAQEAVIRSALSGIPPTDISYVEAHGTATSLGDPVEVKALEAVYGEGRTNDNPLVIGSVKTNIGHTEATAGLAGLLKVVLAMQHNYIPPHLHFKTLNPHINLDKIPACLPVAGIPWENQPDKPRLASVSSFGFSGTNAHIILQEPPRIPQSEPILERSHHLLTLSARTDKALQELIQAYVTYLHVHPTTPIGDLCFTAHTGRTHFDHRLTLVAESATQIREELEIFVAGQAESPFLKQRKIPEQSTPKIAFLFTGQGAQYVGMGQQLYETQPRFRQTIDDCDEILRPYLDKPLLEVLYQSSDTKASSLNETTYTQPALFAVEYALAELWQSWGIKPDAVMGHSVGEYVAACIAGVFSLKDGLKLIAERGRLMQALQPTGEMVVVRADEKRAKAIIEAYANTVSIAAVNGPMNTVISGERQAVKSIVTSLETEGIKTTYLNVSHAFHSPLMEPILKSFAQIAAEIAYATPQIDLISNVTGDITMTISNPEYWVNHIRQPVRFAHSMKTLEQLGYRIFIEIGPQPILLGMGRDCLPESAENIWLPSLRQGVPDWQQLFQSLGTLYLHDLPVDWPGIDRDYPRRRVPLPTYPFQRQRYWINTKEKKYKKTESLSKDSVLNLLQQGETEQLTQQLKETEQFSEDEINLLPKLLKIVSQQHQKQITKEAISDWFYQIEWQSKPRQSPFVAENPSASQWLIFADQGGMGLALANKLKQQGQHGVLVYKDTVPANASGLTAWQINPLLSTDFEHLLHQVSQYSDLRISHLIHFWSLDIPFTDDLTVSTLEQAQHLSCGSVLSLVQTLSQPNQLVLPRLWLVTKGAVPVRHHSLNVAQAPLWGLGKVIALEHPDIWGGMVDLEVPKPNVSETHEDEVSALLAEFWNAEGEDLIALRNGHRYVARLKHYPVPVSKSIRLQPDPSYLITGGLGALGLRVAQWLVAQGVRHLILMSRRQPSKQAQETINQLQQDGAKVLVVNADVASESDISTVFETIVNTMPPLRGVFHAAGVVENEPIKGITLNSMQTVLHPKVQGAWLLHQLTKTMSLDFFVCFSSIASVWGSKGQAHYAAANHFLDMLAHYRRQLGLPALTVNWGPWANGGMASLETQRGLNRQGVETLPPQLAIEALSYLLGTEVCQSIVAHINWPLFKAFYALREQRPLLEQIQVQPSQTMVKMPPAQPSDILQQLKNAPVNDGYEILTTYLQEEVTKILGLDFSEWPTLQKGFFEMGMDSLMAVELRNRLIASMAVSLPTTLVFDYPNIQYLAKYLGNQVFGWVDNKLILEEKPSVLTTVSEIKQLSDDDVEVSIAQKLAKLKTLVTE